MESDKDQNRLMPESELGGISSELSGLFDACARIFRFCKLDTAQAKTLALFESIEHPPVASSTPEELAQRILAAARELRRSVIEESGANLALTKDEAIELCREIV